jgi:sugar lactone lactonase YvrE
MVPHPPRRVATAVLAVAALAAGTGLSAASADTAAPAAKKKGFKVVASKLNNPRGLAVGPNGAIYVAEAGTAGPTCPAPDVCLGYSSSITRIKGGNARRIVKGLPSGGGQDGTFTTGADGVSVDPKGNVFAVMTGVGAEAPPGLPEEAKALLGKLLRIKGGKAGVVADIEALEYPENPDGADLNSNPYGVLALRGGVQYVVDAGANTLIRVKDGKAKVAAIIPPNGPAQSVPTSVAKGPDGALYVGEFGGEGEGAPGPGSQRVFRIAKGKVKVFRKGFTTITGVAFGPDGSLYVSEFNTNPETGAGDVVRVKPNGKRSRLGKGKLFFVGGVAVDGDGHVYASNWSNLPGTGGPAGSPFAGKSGQVVRLK